MTFFTKDCFHRLKRGPHVTLSVQSVRMIMTSSMVMTVGTTRKFPSFSSHSFLGKTFNSVSMALFSTELVLGICSTRSPRDVTSHMILHEDFSTETSSRIPCNEKDDECKWGDCPDTLTEKGEKAKGRLRLITPTSFPSLLEILSETNMHIAWYETQLSSLKSHNNGDMTLTLDKKSLLFVLLFSVCRLLSKQQWHWEDESVKRTKASPDVPDFSL